MQIKGEIPDGPETQSANRQPEKSRYVGLFLALAAVLLTGAVWCNFFEINSTDNSASTSKSGVATPTQENQASARANAGNSAEVPHNAFANGNTAPIWNAPEEPSQTTFQLQPGWLRLAGRLAYRAGDSSFGLVSFSESAALASGISGSRSGGILAATTSGGGSPSASVSSGGGRNITPLASILGTGWTGKGATNNWSDSANWSSTPPASDERNLFFGNAWRDAGANGFITSNNDLSFIGYRITFQDNGFGNPATSFTLTGTGITMVDFSNNAPGIQNDSGLDQNINFSITLKSGAPSGNASAFVTDNNGNINFGSTVTLNNANGAFQFNLQGNSGPTINFNGAVDNGGMRIAQTGNENVIFTAGLSGAGDYLKQGTGTVTFKTATTSFGGGTNNVFIDQGTVAVGTGGSIGTTNGTTTGFINMGSSGTGGLNTTLNIANSSVTLQNPVLVRFLQTGGKTISGTFGSGSSIYSGAIKLADHVSLNAASGGTLVFSGIISQAAGTLSATPGAGNVNNSVPESGNSFQNGTNTKGPGIIINNSASGATGVVEFDAVNTYTGDTVIEAGTLQFKNGGDIVGAGGVVGSIRLGDNASSANATVNIADATTVSDTINARPIPGGGSGTRTISATNAASTTATYSGHIALDIDAAVSSTNSGATLAITQARSSASDTATATDIKNHVLTFTGSGNITVGTTTTSFGTIYNSVAGGSVVKSGAGTLNLKDLSTYSGGTTVNGGTLLVNNTSGSATGSGAVMVNNSGTTLGGSGTITGAVTIGSGANLSPGNSPGILHTGALTLSSGSNLNIELAGANPGTGYDQVISPGAISVAGANLLVATSTALTVNQKFFIVEDSSGTVNNYGLFSNGTTVTDNMGDTFLINYADNGDAGGVANDISLTVTTVVPEPSTWLAGALAFSVLLCFQWKRLIRRRTD